MNNLFINIENFIINKYINKYPLELKDKIFYLLQNGKRIRPILFLIYSGYDNNNNNNNYEYVIYNIALCIEVIHSLSLVLDDLPEMDNDILRRDNKSFHINFGIEYTNFFVYYMFKNIGLELDTCFDILTHEQDQEQNFLNPSRKTAFEKSRAKTAFEKNSVKNNDDINFKMTIISDINNIIKLNMNLLIDGQYNDLQWGSSSSSNNSSSNNNNNNNNNSSNNFLKEKDVIFELLNIDNELINYITTIEKVNDIESNIELNMKKTSSLFNLSITSGYMLQLFINNINYVNSKNNEKYKIIFELLGIFSNILGYMFQISDDLLDIESDREKNKPNICTILDKDMVSKLLKNGCNWLYINNKYIYQLMQQDLENSARKITFEKSRAKSISEKNLISNEDTEDNEDNEDTEDTENTNNKTISFNIKAMNEIIEKIENRIK